MEGTAVATGKFVSTDDAIDYAAAAAICGINVALSAKAKSIPHIYIYMRQHCTACT